MKRGKPASGGGSSKKVEKPITSFFFKQPSPAKAPAAKPSVVDDDEKASASPPSKRRRGSDEEPPAAPVTQKPPTPGKPEEDAPAMDAPATATRYAPAVAAVTAAALASIAPSQPDRHDRFVRKLALDHRRRDGTNRGGAEGEDGATGGGPTGAQNAGIEPGDEPAPREGSRYVWANSHVPVRRPGAPVSTSASSPGGSSSKAPLKMTPLEEQVRRHKAEHPGVVLLIEVGYKFHFYGEDARVAAKTLNIFAYQSRNYLTASVPVPRLHVYVRRLVDAGHKVGVIRQTETAALKAAGEYAGEYAGKSGSGEASGKSGLFERKLVGLYTKSTLEAGVAVDPGGGAHNAVAGSSAADGDWRTTGVLLCVAESFDSPRATSTRIGLVAVDASAGDVRYAEFDDGPARPGLESRLLQLSPAEVLLVEPVSAATNALVAAVFGEGKGARVERIAAESGYADARDAERALARYVEPRTSSENENDDASFSLDENEKRKKTDRLTGKSPLPGGQTARAAATAFDWLRPFGLDGVSRLAGSAAAFKPMAGGDDDGGTMRLSPNVIRQLELFRSSEDTHRGSLVWLLGANAITAGGARLVRRWVAHPLTSVRAIRERLDAVRELAETAEPDSGGRLDALPAALRRCHGAGDAERYLARVFHGTATPAELVTALSAVRAFAGAVAEMAKTKSLQTNRDALEGPSGGSASPCASLLLRRLLAEASDEEVAATCESLLSAVDAEAARSGRATPATALKPDAARFPELEKTRAAVAEAVRDLEGLLPELREQLIRGGASGSDGAAGADGAGSPPFTKKKKTLPAASRAAIPATLGYVTVALVEHLIELPDTAEGVPHDWVRVSTNKSKKVVRYHPPAVLARAAALERARERHARACEAAWRHFLSVECAGKFLELRAATRAAAGLDSLCSLAALARQEGYCCPTFLDDADESDEGDENAAAAFLDIREGRHPVLDATLAGGERVVPNSVRLGTRFPGTRKTSASAMTETNGGDEGLAAVDALAEPPTGSGSENPQNPRALVVTGPNMGGKSCFVRQTALLALMAQCGSFVPARAMTLTAFEGVHTRMGAADNLAMGSSTFLEEMSECAAILRAAAAEKRSLVVLDELGRGTSTHDGVAVAHATLEHLVGGSSASDGSGSGSGTLTLFVTHYPSVARDVVAKRPDACASAFTSYAEKRFLKNRLEPGAEAADDADAADDAYAAADEIDFLYALTPGVAHRSFGLNVARMAGVPPGVLRCAAAKARELETGMAKKAAARAAREARRDGGAGGDGERTLLGACEEIAEASRAVVRALRDAGDVDAVATAQARARDATSRREKK